MISQRGEDGSALIGRQCLAEPKIAGKDSTGALEPYSMLVKQANKRLLTSLQFLFDLALDVVTVRAVDQQKSRNLHEEQQENEKHNNPRFKA